jgi:hypothetical protein
MPKVLNARQAGTKPAADRIYVGRPSKWESVRDRPPRRCPNFAHGPRRVGYCSNSRYFAVLRQVKRWANALNRYAIAR